MGLKAGKMQWTEAEMLRQVRHTRRSGEIKGQWNECRADEHVSQVIIR